MQAAKDSMYVEWRDRLSEANPERTVTVGATSRPALVAVENEAGDMSELDDAYRMQWGECMAVGSGSRLMKMDCTVTYATRGRDGTSGDRGRMLGALDGDLLTMSQPPRTMKMDYTMIPAKSLNTMMFWTDLEFGPPKDEAGRIERVAKTTVYFRASGTDEVKP